MAKLTARVRTECKESSKIVESMCIKITGPGQRGWDAALCRIWVRTYTYPTVFIISKGFICLRLMLGAQVQLLHVDRCCVGLARDRSCVNINGYGASYIN